MTFKDPTYYDTPNFQYQFLNSYRKLSRLFYKKQNSKHCFFNDVKSSKLIKKKEEISTCFLKISKTNYCS